MHTVERKGAAVIGIGNLLMRDEGFGIHVIRYLEDNYRFPDDVIVIDGGTAGIYLAPAFESARHVIVIDVIALDLPPGTMVQLDYKEMSGKSLTTSMSSHQIGILEILEICRFRGTVPERMDFFCVVPHVVETGLDLSIFLRSRVEDMGKQVVQTLERQGHRIEHA